VSSNQIDVRAEGWNHYIERQIGYRWAPVLRAWFPDDSDLSLDWTWNFFQYVFPLSDPRHVSTLQRPDWSRAERAVLDRYVSHARDLASTLQDPGWTNSTVLRGDVVNEVSRLKQELSGKSTSPPAFSSRAR